LHQYFATVAKTISGEVGKIVIFLPRFWLRFSIDSYRAGVLLSKSGGSGFYSIDALTQQSLLGMLESGAGGLPASAVPTIDTLEQSDTNMQQTVQGLARISHQL
jgi:hypothetical protein